MSELTQEDLKFINSCKRKVFDGCNQYELMMKLKKHANKAIRVGNEFYLIIYREDKGVGMASGYSDIYLKPLE